MVRNVTSGKFLTGTIIIAAVLVSAALVFTGFQVGKSSLSHDDIQAAVVDGINQFAQEGPRPVENKEAVNESPEGEDVAQEPPEDIDISDLNLEDSATLGNIDAPVTIVEFSDFQCPACKKFIFGAYPEIKENYVNSGQVNLVFKHLPLSMHPGAYPAALATECVREQAGDEAFFLMHDQLFADQSILNDDDEENIKEALKTLATGLGVDSEVYESCVTSEKYRSQIEADIALADALKLNGTPSFIVNGEIIVGAYPFETFESLIEEGL